ncbi:hypothetical protein [Streptomyces sp. NPDC004629]|uniref:hypothetical protein n=1 Tax=Streptomyces sp. NPDC004629 TaxID=3364705 RepID=UPI0036B68A61
MAPTKTAAKELTRFGITVNAYCPQAASPGHLSFNATQEAAGISGAVFSVPGGGQISLHAELREAVPQQLMKGFVSAAERREF